MSKLSRLWRDVSIGGHGVGRLRVGKEVRKHMQFAGLERDGYEHRSAREGVTPALPRVRLAASGK